jgi:HemK-like putative methylase
MHLGELLAGLDPKDRDDAIWLLCSLLDLSRSDIILNPRRMLESAFLKDWKKVWRRRNAGEPLQFIVGSAPFYGREFKVRKGVLVPRPETEFLAELCLNHFPAMRPLRVLDIGTGTGAIALTLKLERPHWQVMGSDISPIALRTAKENAEALGGEVLFEKHDLFGPKLRAQEWDLVVSNPPYLNFEKDEIAEDVKAWEPKLVLEPLTSKKVAGLAERGAWCAEHILLGCVESRVELTVMELSPRVALVLERRWRKHPKVERAWRVADLAGRKRFLLVAWKNA